MSHKFCLRAPISRAGAWGGSTPCRTRRQPQREVGRFERGLQHANEGRVAPPIEVLPHVDTGADHRRDRKEGLVHDFQRRRDAAGIDQQIAEARFGGGGAGSGVGA